jgi:cyclopropane fatty-acyl-phospholipid synthase-like methyltransferase
MSSDVEDASGGWNAVAAEFIARRNPRIGVATVIDWAISLPKGASILDLGCGHGTPISAALVANGFDVYGVDVSPALVEEFRRRLSGATVRCEAVETSTFFGRHFDGAVAVGLMFLLPEEGQVQLINRVARVLNPGGRFLFSSPTQDTTWEDIMTGRQSRSLGIEAYKNILRDADLELLGEYTDEGENHYYSTRRVVPAAA